MTDTTTQPTPGEVPERLTTALADRYDLIRELGAGGMATVYLADDLKHNRKVAVKVLRPELAAVVGAERFLTEIETTANLQHPHILPLHDSGEADTFLFYVMPFVDGETLQQRLDREHQLPVEEAVRVATDMAEALDYAHRAGVIHRDIKPANVLMHEGRPLIADFGIALAVGAAGGTRLTETGLSVGTPFYMSPEQATGQAIGAASDTYSLACVFYEMLIGEPPYPGATPQAVLGKIIAGEPVSATKMRQSIPPHVDAAIRHALEKLPADRFTSTQDFARALGDSGYRYGVGVPGGTVEAGPDAGRWKRNAIIGWGAAAAAVAGLFAFALQPEEAAPVERFSLYGMADNTATINFVDVADDGSFIVFSAPDEEGTGGGLWLRRWSDLAPIPVPGATGAFPGISPDGSEVAYVSGTGELVAIPVVGGIPRTLADSAGCCVRWANDGYVYYSSLSLTDVYRVPAAGGDSELLATGEDGETWLGEVQPLPDGERVLVSVCCELPRIEVLDLATGDRQVVTPGLVPYLLPSGKLIFTTADGEIMAAPFDSESAELSGSAIPMIDQVSLAGGALYPLLTVGDDGTLVYLTGVNTVNAQAEFVWVDRNGAAVPIDPGWTFESGDVNRGWRLSPDDSQLAFRAAPDGSDDVWIKQLPDGPLSRLTFDDGIDRMPRWTADGSAVTFISNRADGFDIWKKSADGTGQAELVFDHDEDVSQGFVSPDGEWVVMRISGFETEEGVRDVYAARIGDDTATPMAADETYHEGAPALSPDGRWLAYQSSETGDWEIFVRPFPDVESGRWQVSTNGGYSPLWANSGDELFFIDSSNNLVAAAVETDPSFQTSSPQVLFTVGPEFLIGTVAGMIDITSDDQRFVMARIATSAVDENAADPELILVQNWGAELEARIGN